MGTETFAQHRQTWEQAARSFQDRPDHQATLAWSRHALGLTLGLAEGSRVRSSHGAQQREGSRILTKGIRRHYGLISASESALVESVADASRSLLELLFQSFYLLRCPSPEKDALDAYNLSFKKWLKDADSAVETGRLSPEDSAVPPNTEERNQINAILANYPKKPLNYLDKNFRLVTQEAGLTAFYDLFYGPLSRVAHNSPVADGETWHLQKETAALLTIPSDSMIDEMIIWLNTGTQFAVMASLGGLALFADVDHSRASEVLCELETMFGLDWKAELKTLADQWGCARTA